jgi:hypothetical protein
MDFSLSTNQKSKKIFSDLVAHWAIYKWFHDGEYFSMWQEYKFKLEYSKLASGGLLLTPNGIPPKPG